MPPRPRSKYKGDKKKLVFALDIGTTFSGISYCRLIPGEIPEVNPVTQYPQQKDVSSDAKVPSIAYYDSKGKLCAIGAETSTSPIRNEARVKGWHKAQWSKLHLRPEELVKPGESVPPLPPGKTVEEIIADIMGYLYKCGRDYVEQSHQDGVPLKAFRDEDIHFILTHPNGWGGVQQARMRKAAIAAELIPDTPAGHSRITFTTEGESSLHFCLSGGLKVDYKERGGILIADAGGGTIDMSVYRRVKGGNFEEVTVPSCHFQGSIYVNVRAEEDFKKKLGNDPRYADSIPLLVDQFERMKPEFKSKDSTYFLQFSSPGVNDPALGISGGQLEVPGASIAKYFGPSVACIVEGVKQQQKKSNIPIKFVFLVGGFSASGWLFEQVEKKLRALKITVKRLDRHGSKAVANGGVFFFLDRKVSSRVSRLTYGIEVDINYNPSDRSHLKRCKDVVTHPVSGRSVLPETFSTILKKNVKVKDLQEFSESYEQLSSTSAELQSIKCEILSYRGKAENPSWISSERDMYPVLCVVEADTSSVRRMKSYDDSGKAYYGIKFDIVLSLGLTELKAHIAYFDSVTGEKKKGEARVVFVDDVNTLQTAMDVDEDDTDGDPGRDSDHSFYCDE